MINVDLKGMERVLDSAGSWYGPVARNCEQCKQGSVKGRRFFISCAAINFSREEYGVGLIGTFK
jgi:hypothetical protein